jgi:poly(A) polymerase
MISFYQDRIAHLRPLFDAFSEEGHQLVLVGGAVRDAVMNLPDKDDFDFATSALPEQTEAILRNMRLAVYTVGARFGTIAAVWKAPNRERPSAVEITTFRVEETYAHDSRKPEVRFGTSLEGDLARRDLSINAMAMDASGNIIDPYHGRRAIEIGRLEVPGGGLQNTLGILSDDPLRILRIARFASRFGFPPTDETTEATRQSAHRLQAISHERWKMEFDKLLVAPLAPFGLRWLRDVGALNFVWPELHALSDDAFARLLATIEWLPAEKGPRYAASVIFATLNEQGGGTLRLDSLPLSLRHAQHLADTLSARLKFSNEERSELRALVSFTYPPSAILDSWTSVDVRHRWQVPLENLSAQLTLAAALLQSVDAREAAEVNAAVVELAAQIDSQRERENLVPVLPTGLGDAMKARGLQGKDIGQTMVRIREAILDGELSNEASIETYVDWLFPNEQPLQ